MTAKSNKDATAQGVLNEVSGSARDAFRRGKADAQAAVDRSLPAIRYSIAKGIYVTCYYLAFGAVYSSKLVMELVPEDSMIREGFKSGAAAADEAYARRHSSHGEASGMAPSPAAGN